ncbi:7-cyano-7-deazaguanine synthase, partial [archaeon]|nr:7-cyano-7-deazaguanine synthase [archaeon]
KIFIELTKKAYIYTEKIQAHGGLPVGSSGKVICLLSGGIDSPVAAWLAMRRGCKVDFLHFHTFQENKQVLGTKIENLVKKLNEYQGRSRLFLIPYHIYQFESLNTNERIDLVLFKNFILRMAQEIAIKEDYKAIITGDNLGQVASQTLQNLQATSYCVNTLILRPVITYTKDEIIKLAQEIGVYEESIKEYKDCCSILSKKPLTRASIEQVESALGKIDIKEITNKSLEKLEVFNF